MTGSRETRSAAARARARAVARARSRERSLIAAIAVVAMAMGCGGSQAGAETSLSRGEPIAASPRDEAAERAKLASAAAAAIEKDVVTAHTMVKRLADTLAEASKRLAANQYPADVPGQLAELHIAFDAGSLADGRASDLPPALLRSLIAYAVEIKKLNRDKDSLRNILVIAQAPLEKHWKETIAPVAHFSVLVRAEGSKGMVAELVPNKDPFPMGAEWPPSYAILTPETTTTGKKVVEKRATRWVKGSPKGADPIAIPVAPTSVAVFTSEELALKLAKALRDVRLAIEGESEGDASSPGVLQQGEAITSELRKLSQVKPSDR
jgi:hypothetical protein